MKVKHIKPVENNNVHEGLILLVSSRLYILLSVAYVNTSILSVGTLLLQGFEIYIKEWGLFCSGRRRKTKQTE